MNKVLPLALSYDDVLLVPNYSGIRSRSEVDLSVQLTPHLKLKLPIISSNMDTVTNVQMAVTLGKLGGLGVLPRFNQPDEQADHVREVQESGVIAAAAIGVREGFKERAKLLVDAGVNVFVLDVAHGHQQQVVDAIKFLKDAYPDIDLIAGNVATYQAAHDLFAAGADCLKVGIGPGSICTTRIQTGFGVPQITALMDAALAAREFKRTLISDGGMKNSGDIVKALAAGAHAIMTGNLLAGTDETPGEFIEKDGKKYKQYNGSTSAAEKRRQAEKLGEKLPENYIIQVEGVEGLIPARGPVAGIIESLTAGIRSGYSYAGAKNIEELHRLAKFMRISPQGRTESGAHDITQI